MADISTVQKNLAKCQKMKIAIRLKIKILDLTAMRIKKAKNTTKQIT